MTSPLEFNSILGDQPVVYFIARLLPRRQQMDAESGESIHDNVAKFPLLEPCCEIV